MIKAWVPSSFKFMLFMDCKNDKKETMRLNYPSTPEKQYHSQDYKL